ncbi:hypothetical protein PV325_005903 [Microctonus aethiopoides]|nr:hypothetical protein PV325_005903 [Microctonus aethiopoides]
MRDQGHLLLSASCRSHGQEYSDGLKCYCLVPAVDTLDKDGGIPSPTASERYHGRRTGTNSQLRASCKNRIGTRAAVYCGQRTRVGFGKVREVVRMLRSHGANDEIRSSQKNCRFRALTRAVRRKR